MREDNEWLLQRPHQLVKKSEWAGYLGAVNRLSHGQWITTEVGVHVWDIVNRQLLSKHEKKLVLLPNPSVTNKVLTMNRINNKSFYHKYFSWRENPLVANFQFFKIVNISILQSNRRLDLDEDQKSKVSVTNPASFCLPPHLPLFTKNLSGTD